MVLTDYEHVVGEDNNLLGVGVECRRAGTDEHGPTDWTPIATVSPGPEYTTVWWHRPDTMPDGVYELRAYAECNRGKGYSVFSRGTIDRHVPVVFGTPEPSDRELSLGEDISITFNEPIDCSVSGLDTLITLIHIDGPDSGITIPVETVCNGSTIIISPKEDGDLDDLEGRKVKTSVTGICDLVGNPMSDTTTWWFTVRQSVFTWSKMNLFADVAFRSPGSISAELVNGSDTIADFSITGMPEWIVDASPSAGSIEPGGSQTVTFTIQEDIGIAVWDGQVTSVYNVGSAVLNVYLTVSCHEPTWSLDPGKYEHSMTIVAEVSIDDNTANDPDDRVAAFVGAQLRGVANVEPGMSNSKVVFLTVYSNRTGGETVRFQVWDNDQCQLYNSTFEHYAFVSNGMIGSPDDPVPLTAADVLPDNVQVIPLSQGWNWFSTYVTGVDMSADGVLSDLTPAFGDILKSQTAFAQFDPGMGWVGSLQLLDNVSAYMVKLSEPGNIIQEGSVVDPLTTLVQVVDGWNWVGYLPDGPIEVGEALQDLNAILAGGDMVRSQYSFSQFVNSGNDVGWYGDLKSMEPGEGYKLYLGNGSEAGDGFRYPSNKGASPTSPPVISEQVICRKTESVEELPDWTVSQNAYQYNMTVIARLNIEGSEGRSDNDVIGAFVDGECRGIARPIHLPATDKYAAFLMIHSNEAVGESVNFQVFVPESRMVYNVAEVITYEADASAGTVREPLMLRTSGAAYEVPETMPIDYSLSQNYPNPFNPVTIIRYSLPAPGEITLTVYNILGQKVRTLVSGFVDSGPHEAAWNGRDEDGQPVSTGVYLYRIESAEFSQTKKMILIK